MTTSALAVASVAALAITVAGATPGPIIVLKPKENGATLQTSWTTNGSSTPAGANTNVSIRFVGRIVMSGGNAAGFSLKRKSESNPEYPTEVILTIDDGATTRQLSLRRALVGSDLYLSWRMGESTLTPLNVCDDVSANCVADCTNLVNTVPSGAFGEILDLETDLDPEVDLDDLDWINIQVDVAHPCP